MTSAQTPNKTKRSTSFSIRSIFAITTVCAAAAVSVGYLYRAANGDLDEIGPFVIFTAVSPLALMVLMSWAFKVSNWIIRKSN